MNPVILFQDQNYVMLNKPSHMIVNKADTSKGEYTVQEWILENFSEHFLGNGVENTTEFFKRGGIVHRLDKDTSGVLIIALNEQSFVELQQQFKMKTVKKVYSAVVHGKLVDEGEI